jgi:hypothetical protein
MGLIVINAVSGDVENQTSVKNINEINAVSSSP